MHLTEMQRKSLNVGKPLLHNKTEGCITKLIKSHECKLKRTEHQVDQLRAKLNRINHRAL